jgi:ribosomal-protein-alanine N-acetyltransferase
LSELSRIDSLILIAKIRNKTVGFIVMRPIIHKYFSIYNEAEILNFSVARHYQRCGIGTKLLQQAIKMVKVSKIWLEVRKYNHGGVEFYLKNGFEVAGERRNYYLNPQEDALLMELKIPS